MTDVPFHHVVFHIATVCPGHRGSGFPPLIEHIPISAVVLAFVQDDIIITSKTVGAVGDSWTVTDFFFEELQGGPWHLVSFKGRSFSLPVMVYSALRHGVDASSYLAEDYHPEGDHLAVHTDLLDWMTNYGLVEGGSLATYVDMVGLPPRAPTGKYIADQFASGRTDLIEGNLCVDVMLTAAVFLRTMLVKGALTKQQYSQVTKAMMKQFFDTSLKAEEYIRSIDKNVLKAFFNANKVY